MTEKKRILFILPAMTAGGAERVLITLMNGLDRSRFEPVFLTVSDEGPMKSLIDPEIPVYSLGKKRVLFSMPYLYVKIKKLKPDAVVSTMAHFNFILLLLKPFFFRTPFIVREAITPSYILDEHPLLAPFLKFSYRCLYPKAAKVISPAQRIIDEFRDVLGMSCANHELLYNPVDLVRVRRVGQESQGLDMMAERGEGVNFVAAGRLHYQKGYDRLIESLAKYDMRYPWQLTIWGEGPQRPVLEKIIREKGLQDRVFLPGYTSAPWPYIKRADCFLMPSRWEGLPNVVLEALACGTPVIATAQSGGIQEIAELAPTAVTVVENINDFLHAMQTVKPAHDKPCRESLLPESFEMETACARFSEILVDILNVNSEVN